jgi:ABC-type transport system involved in cytochrome bd biosynthesis fused ATPase/permease subunit
VSPVVPRGLHDIGTGLSAGSASGGEGADHGRLAVLTDRATAALDVNVQRELQATLHGPDRAWTLSRVSQRLSTVADADCIYVLDGGRIVERGAHDELVAQGGLCTQPRGARRARLRAGS